MNSIKNLFISISILLCVNAGAANDDADPPASVWSKCIVALTNSCTLSGYSEPICMERIENDCADRGLDSIYCVVEKTKLCLKESATENCYDKSIATCPIK